MSQYVYGQGQIEIVDPSTEALSVVISLMNNTEGICNAIVSDEILGTSIQFEMSGYNRIDYTPLNIIRDAAVAMELDFSIEVFAYVSLQDNGYKYDSKEE